MTFDLKLRAKLMHKTTVTPHIPDFLLVEYEYERKISKLKTRRQKLVKKMAKFKHLLSSKHVNQYQTGRIFTIPIYTNL